MSGVGRYISLLENSDKVKHNMGPLKYEGMTMTFRFRLRLEFTLGHISCGWLPSALSLPHKYSSAWRALCSSAQHWLCYFNGTWRSEKYFYPLRRQLGLTGRARIRILSNLNIIKVTKLSYRHLKDKIILPVTIPTYSM